MLMRISAAIGLLFLAAGVIPAVAHHGWSGYDATKEMTLTGTIKEAGYEHPHGHVRLEVPGKVWLVVLAPPPPHADIPARLILMSRSTKSNFAERNFSNILELHVSIISKPRCRTPR